VVGQGRNFHTSWTWSSQRGNRPGLGLAVPNQTLPATRIDFSAPEKKDLLTFLASLTDTTGPAPAYTLVAARQSRRKKARLC
jgi:hypothetical protein